MNSFTFLSVSSSFGSLSIEFSMKLRQLKQEFSSFCYYVCIDILDTAGKTDLMYFWVQETRSSGAFFSPKQLFRSSNESFYFFQTSCKEKTTDCGFVVHNLDKILERFNF
ncbi:Hypothetical_protein [Hexamita inflata]|uniref:Hypothetical_protein n=1 Tax=Hexamita inflata TaxID=28002 RepID=A0AA86QYZ7_9EUKA|nr:Hypothetical protein HINF_LOCUS50797 [Hexamita inflata]